MAQPLVLTETQKKVMKWLGHGWVTERGAGASVMVNGQRMCNTDTMKALQRAGYVEEHSSHGWKATAAGRAIAATLGL